ncbi:LANO_0B06370g1_1 [Lachancea nothofagi CBS 11611]|uniref:LANO_0B06370g1_1 n=1 Tax=Lachancea nothofagi CBS 11611 TaxID=1266666 RepID=A0A1G4IYY5_9SACH|nr:LANO_0B06370g1_1 [Lachancea nothofagi CBS 11611]
MEDSSIFSQSSQDVSSTISLYNMSTAEDASVKAIVDYDLSEEAQGSGISRPLSRSSATSSLSMVATKDGIEGRRVHRYGIPQYSLNLLNSMSSPGTTKSKVHSKQQHLPNHIPYHKSLHAEELGAIAHSDLSSGPVMTLQDKMRLLNYKSGSVQYSSSVESLQDRNDEFQADGFESDSDAKGGSLSLLGANGNEAGSNRSTTGDDYSYLHDTKSLPPVSIPIESERE